LKIKSIAIGSFDGVHLAHQELIKRVDGVIIIEKNHATLTPGWKRTLFINKACFFYHIDKIKPLTPQEFIAKLQNDFPHLEKIVVGYDFEFGKNRAGNARTIKEYFNGTVEIVSEIKLNNISIHSRVIRELIVQNSISLANKMLNRLYKIDGKHIKGLGLGGKELVATINLQVQNYTLPNGVFSSYTTINQKRYRSICFVGHRESVDNSHTIEVHILEEFNDTTNSQIYVEFVELIRNSKKFDSLKALKSQIMQDIKLAKKQLAIN
jgi:riboflavin kinase/FMN adenylyltransferase